MLHLDREDQRLQAYDAITLGRVGTSGARISRTVVERDEPQPGPSPTPTGG